METAAWKRFRFQAEPSVQVGPPKALFKIRTVERFRNFAVSADGQRILVNQRVGEDDCRFTIVLNWTAGLK
jgi:hypothetical protein